MKITFEKESGRGYRKEKEVSQEEKQYFIFFFT